MREKNMKKMMIPVLLAALMMGACSKPAAVQETAGDGTQSGTQNTQETAEEKLLSGLHHVEITVKDYGVIKLELDADEAPITVTNFVQLAQSGFYDGLTFHRIMDGFMIQGGDPTGTGFGGSSKTIKGEFSQNGVQNNISHAEGVISMARAQDPDSASSQFFITVADAKFLDSAYAGFGHVTEGMEIAKKIASDAKPTDANGSIDPQDQPVIESIKVID
ncbi:MAG: peptidylprolyl isomerase [Solobacterium sp.]|nr:peptidylprolyl isomerase [Solobacterium sp.]